MRKDSPTRSFSKGSQRFIVLQNPHRKITVTEGTMDVSRGISWHEVHPMIAVSSNFPRLIEGPRVSVNSFVSCIILPLTTCASDEHVAGHCDYDYTCTVTWNSNSKSRATRATFEG